MNAKDYLKGCKIRVWENSFSVIQARRPEAECVMCFKDKNEITLVAEMGKVAPENIIREEKGWKIITFDALLPFELTGFLAAVSSVLAEEQISIFAISSFSTDHLLVKQEQLEMAIEKLERLGCVWEGGENGEG